MLKRKKASLFVLVAGLLLAALLAGCGGQEKTSVKDQTSAKQTAPSKEASNEKVILRFEFDENTKSVTASVVQRMADRIKERTNGRVELLLNPSCGISGGSIPTMIRNTQNGTVDIALLPSCVYTSLEQRLTVLSLPFMFKDINELERIGRYNDKIKAIYAEQKNKGLTIIDAWARALRQIVVKNKEI